MKKVFLIHGPNFDILELRDRASYGGLSLADIENCVRDALEPASVALESFQSNCEGQIVECIHKALRENADAIIINAAAYSHTSIAILDALSCYQGPILEVHLSNIFRREQFRHGSYVSLAATGIICGLGLHGYRAAAQAVIELIGGRS